MEQSILSLSVSFAVASHNGSAGVTPTFASPATKDRMKGTIYQDTKEVNCQSVLALKSAH